MQQPRNISNFRRSLVSSVRTGANNVFFTGHNDTLYSCIPEQQTRERGVQYLRLGYTYGYYVVSLPSTTCADFRFPYLFEMTCSPRPASLLGGLRHCIVRHRIGSSVQNKQQTIDRHCLGGVLRTIPQKRPRYDPFRHASTDITQYASTVFLQF